MIANIKDTAFGKNDIRGIYGEDVTEELFYYVGKAYIRFIEQKTGDEPRKIWVSLAKDARNHSPVLAKSVMKGVLSTGANILDIGLVPTPLAYYSEFCTLPKDIMGDNKLYGSLTVTASHNPSEYNGLKMTFNKASMTEEDIKLVKKLTFEILNEREKPTRFGVSKMYNIINNYVDKMTHQHFAQIGNGIKVVVDSANATAGVVAPRLYRDLGCEVIELYSEPDGNFPNHHPNPSDETTLDDIKQAVINHKADVGLAFDGDTDRIGVIDSKGNKIAGDILLLIYSLDIVKDLVKRGEKPAVVSEVKCSQILFDEINAVGAKAVMCKTGHGYIKAKMKEENAIFGGEMSGHIFFKDRYYGFDDAIYAGCRLIEIIAKYKRENPEFKVEDLIAEYNSMSTSSELRFYCPNDLKAPALKRLETLIEENKNLFQSEIKEIITIDGMRIVFEDGFALIRQSNTEPVFTLRFEAKTDESCKRYHEIMLSELENILKEF